MVNTDDLCIKQEAVLFAFTFVLFYIYYILFLFKPVPLTTNVLSSNPAQARCIRYNIMW
jgi:hypothetical protein